MERRRRGRLLLSGMFAVNSVLLLGLGLMLIWPATTSFPGPEIVGRSAWLRFDAEVKSLGRVKTGTTLALAKPVDASQLAPVVIDLQRAPILLQQLKKRPEGLRVEVSALAPKQTKLSATALAALERNAERGATPVRASMELRAAELGFGYLPSLLVLILSSMILMAFMGAKNLRELEGQRMLLISKTQFRQAIEFGTLLIGLTGGLVADALLRRLGVDLPWPFPFGALCVFGAPLVVLGFKFALPRATSWVGIGVSVRR